MTCETIVVSVLYSFYRPLAVKSGRPEIGVAHKGQKWAGHGSPSPIASAAYVSDYSFLMPQSTAKFERRHPIRCRQVQVALVKIGHFRQINPYNLITVQDA